MVEHFLIGAWARDSVVDGRLQALRVPLRELADYRYEAVVPGGWMQGVAKLQAAARLTSDAETLETAASGVAAMARVCGECHVEQAAKLSYTPPTLSHYTPMSDEVEGRMLRHFSAAQRMWEGLVLPSDTAWLAGATALSHAPVTAPKLHAPARPGFAQALTSLRELGARATRAATLDERTNLYGLLLATCAHCHASNAVFAF